MKVLTGDQLKTAETVLRDFFPQSQLVYGFIFNINRVKSDPIDVFVDNWPNFTTILCVPRREEDGDSFKDMCVFTKEESALREFLAETSVINWGEFFCLAVDLCHEEVLRGVARDKGTSANKPAVCHLMKLQDPSILPTLESGPPLKISSLDESHVDLVNRTWKFGNGEHSVRMIRDMIRHFPSCCVLDGEGQAVAWILTYATCAMGMLYTLPEHRGKGYAKILICTMATRLHAQGYPVYCFIEEENQLSYRLFKNLGFTEDPAYRAAWFNFNHL